MNHTPDMARVQVKPEYVVGCCTIMLALGCAGSTDEPAAPAQDYQELKLEISGGFGPPPCSNGKDSYGVVHAPGHLTWAGCDYNKSPAEPVMGNRPLSNAEVQSVTQALSKVHASSAKTCGADASLLTLDVTTKTGVERYADDFYSGCPWEAHAGRIFVTGLGDLGSVLSQLAKQ